MRFVRTSLSACSPPLMVQLSHEGEPCPHPAKLENGRFTVLDVSGIHSINLSFCSCEGAPPRHVQVLRRGWWPATPTLPASAVTMRLLRLYEKVYSTSKANIRDFYRSLVLLTDSTGSTHLPVRSLLQQELLVLTKLPFRIESMSSAA
jgi:hypothetical protein